MPVYKGYKYLSRAQKATPTTAERPGRRQRFKIIKKKKPKRIRYLPFPPKQNRNQKEFYKLTYADSVALTTSTTASGEYAFRMNSLFDPDYSGTGHQPFGHDQLAQLWKRYKVHKVNVKVVGHTTTAHNGFTFYIRAGDSISVSNTNTSQLIREGGFAEVVKEIVPLHTAVGSGSQFFASKTFKTRKYATQGLNDTTNYAADFGANPSDSIFIILGQCTDTTTSLSVYVHVLLTFYFEVSEPILVSQS